MALSVYFWKKLCIIILDNIIKIIDKHIILCYHKIVKMLYSIFTCSPILVVGGVLETIIFLIVFIFFILIISSFKFFYIFIPNDNKTCNKSINILFI